MNAMIRNLKYLVAVALGFSTACSTVKQAPREKRADETDPSFVHETDTARVPPRIVVMYGVRPPLSDSLRLQRMARMAPDSLPPVAEEPQEEDVRVGR